MECNKDEAIRAKEIAEKKMQNHDFEGARRFANKARNLFPELENISQLLAVCDVHCSAQSKVYGSEKDLYGILQVERLADEPTIRKQYRKLALVLHPDKNKFPGTEAAFKLVGEAHMILSDKGKRSLHDIKCNEATRTTNLKMPRHQGNQNTYKQGAAHYKIPKASYQFNSVNHHQSAQSNNAESQQTFWTYCPFCRIKYQYYKNFVNKSLRCQSCSKPFIAHDIGPQGAWTGSCSGHPGNKGVNLNSGQTNFCQQKEAPKQGIFETGSLGTGGFCYQFESQTNSSTGVRSDQWTSSERSAFGWNSKNQVKQNGKEESAMPKSKEEENARRKNRRRRKVVFESSESCGDASDTNTEATFEGNGGCFNAGEDSVIGDLHYPRRSSRPRQRVSGGENPGEHDDILSPLKRSKMSHLSSDSEGDQKQGALSNRDYKVGKSSTLDTAKGVDEDISKQKASPRDEVKGMAYDCGARKHKLKREEDMTLKNHSESDLQFDCSENPDFYECADPEFSDFDKYKEEHCFAVDQIWACYDSVDSMPRFYAQVRRVFSPGFKLRITWLEADPEAQQEVDWADEGLPVSCGKFKHGSSEQTSDRLMFSHQMFFEKGSGRCSYVIYPKKGEIWALFKDWDIMWSSDPENHRKYKFEIVEVVSDFSSDVGIRVAYLEKVKGFVSLFQKISNPGPAECVISSRELLRFSHRIPSFEMSGTEREGVPTGSCELDPASLPTNIDELYSPHKVEMDPGNIEGNGADFLTPSYVEKVKSKTDLENMGTPIKDVNFEGNNDISRKTVMPRRSPRELNGRDKNRNQVHASQSFTQPGISKPLNFVQKKSSDDTPLEKPFCEVGCERYDGMKTGPNTIAKSPRFSTSSGVEKPEEVFHDFNRDKLESSFQEGQIWALYKNKDSVHQRYAQIKKIESFPFRLHAALLESCIQSKNASRCESCGLFKTSCGKPKIFPPQSFSHRVEAELNGKSKFNIYPREQEIWAVYSKQDINHTGYYQETGEYDIIEVLESDEHCTKVGSLIRVPGFKSVFRFPRRQRSTARIMEIPRVELSRFSHQIPAFQLTTEKCGDLRGCWELDPAAVPGNLSTDSEVSKM